MAAVGHFKRKPKPLSVFCKERAIGIERTQDGPDDRIAVFLNNRRLDRKGHATRNFGRKGVGGMKKTPRREGREAKVPA